MKMKLTILYEVYLQIGNAHCCYHAKHDEEHSTNDRVWNSYKDCTEFTKESQDDHKKPSGLKHQSAANLAHNLWISHQKYKSSKILS